MKEEQAAILVSGIALVVSIVALRYARGQARAMQLSLAPNVKIVAPGEDSLILEFSGPQVRKAKVKLVSDQQSIAVLDGPEQRSIAFKQLVEGHRQRLSLNRTGETAETVVLLITMWGPGFRKAARRKSCSGPPKVFVF